MTAATANGMQDFTNLVNLCHLLLRCENVPGDVVEFGCYRGDTAKLMAALTDKKLVLYDSFAGLPVPSRGDDGLLACYEQGAQRTNAAGLANNFERDRMDVPEIVNGWFNQISEHQLPRWIAFAHIDAVLCESTLDALMLVYPRLHQGAVCLVNGYGNPPTPGVKRALDEFLIIKPEGTTQRGLPAGAGKLSKQGYFVKL